MPSPKGTIHIDKALTDFSLRYSNGELIADMVCPRITVAKESDKYFLYGKQNFRTENDVRADGTEAKSVDPWSIADTPTYTALERALKSLVTDRERSNADVPLNPDYDCTQNITEKIALNRELRVADLFCTYANFATSGHRVTLAGVQQWNNAAFNSTSKTDAIEVRIDTAKEAIRSDIGQDPNTIIIPSAVAKVMKRDSAIRDLVKYTAVNQQLLVNGDLPQTLWNMKVIIPGAIYDTAEEGQTFSGADVWGKNVILCYLAPNPRTPRTMTFSLTFQSQPRQVKQWRVEKLKGDQIEISEILVEKMVSEYCGYMIKDVIA